MSDDSVLVAMRAAAFERAIGELKGALSTYYGGTDEFIKSCDALEEFEEHCRDNGLFGN